MPEEQNDDANNEPGNGSQGATRTAAPKYVAPTTQEEFDEIFERRLARERTKLETKFSDYDALKEKASRHDALEAELASDSEKAAKTAREEARAEALQESTPRIVRAEFKAEAKGVLTADQLTALLEDLDLSKYADDDGEPDSEKIAAKIAKFAPAKSDDKTRRVNLGQGNHQQASPSQRDIGRAAAQKRFGTKQ